MKKDHLRLRAFCSTFMLTLCVLLLGIGFLTADYNSRRTAFGEERLRIAAYGPEQQLPQEMQTWSGRLWNLLPARCRVAIWVTETESAAVPLLHELAQERGMLSGGD